MSLHCSIVGNVTLSSQISKDQENDVSYISRPVRTIWSLRNSGAGELPNYYLYAVHKDEKPLQLYLTKL
jgi:hypothetical protein